MKKWINLDIYLKIDYLDKNFLITHIELKKNDIVNFIYIFGFEKKLNKL